MTIALALAGLVMAACASENEQADLRPLALKEQASSIVKSGAGYVVNWAGVLSNTNRWHFGENPVAVISAVDAGGKEVVHLEQPLDAVPPGRSLAFTGQAMSSVRPVRVKIDYRPATWRRIPRIPSAFRTFPVADVATERLPNGAYLITGYVLDPFLKAASSLAVTALLRDATGKLLGGGTSYVDNVRPDARRRFVITVEGMSGGPATRTDVLARTWGTTAKPYEDLALGGAVPVHTVKPTTKPFAKDRGYQPIIDRRQ